MEKQGIYDHGEMVDEEFPDEFQCCVCLDIMYKPVVLVCGHISCFWCVLKAMDSLQESHCPVCRNPYNHFPRVCGLLHFLLLKLYPRAYKKRENQVAEEEKRNGIYGHEYHHFDGNLIDSQYWKIIDVQGISSPQRTSREHDKTSTLSSSSQTTCNEANSLVEHTNKVLVTDLQCVVCKQLLCHPVVLNCGHVYCESCIDPHPQDNICKCPVCQSAHPKGFPNVCLVLEHFLEERFPEEYSARKASLPQCLGPSGKKQEEAAQSSYVPPTHVYSSLFSGIGAELHPGVGCDYCGVYPIIGLRYRCKDCLEKIGFDLCEDCYNSSSNVCGRFNQQHTKEHKFEVMQPPNLQNTILRLVDELSEGSDEDMGDYIPSVYFSDNGVVITASPESSGEDHCDLDHFTAAPGSSNDHSEER